MEKPLYISLAVTDCIVKTNLYHSSLLRSLNNIQYKGIIHIIHSIVWYFIIIIEQISFKIHFIWT